MQLPLSLIQSWLPTKISPTQIGEVLTLLGVEVDHIHNEKVPFSGVVVGELLSVEPHPNAEKLRVVRVSCGQNSYTLVCGDASCRVGMKTAFAQIGAILTDDDGTERRIEKTTIRGVESSGMLCTAAELRLGKEAATILDLPHEMQTGDDLAKLLWDPVFEVSLTPNLGHCMSALGIARELSAALQLPLHYPTEKPLNTTLLPLKVQVHNSQLCPRYMCHLLEDVHVESSPFWLQRQLEACGQKALNHVVDATNYILMKYGQPMHAFDYDRLETGILSVEPAHTALQFLCLDGVEREVPAGTLMIMDGKRPIAIAGIMGGANSAVSQQTKRVLLEAASFDPILVRKAAKKMNLRSESSQRFEKGIDVTGIPRALAAAIHLIGGKSVGGVDVKKGEFVPKKISLRPERVNRLLGTKLSVTEIGEIFARLQFTMQDQSVIVPLFRTDIHEEIDLVEEVARIYGYNHIEKPLPQITASRIPNDPMFVFENATRQKLAALGLMECITCDLISPQLADVAKMITPSSMGFLKTTYSKSEEYSVLRTSLLPGLLQVAARNIDQKNTSLALFEIGRIHFLQQDHPTEIPMGAILLTGHASLPHWSHKETEFDYFDLKGLVENLTSAPFQPSQHLSLHPGRQSDICIQDLCVGSLGEVHPHILNLFHIEERVYYAEFHLPHLMHASKTHGHFSPLPLFPSSERDWTIPLDPKVEIGPLLTSIESLQSILLEKVELIDLYMPEGNEKKHATLRFTYRDKLKTVSFAEVEAEHATLVSATEKTLAKRTTVP